MTWKIVHQNNCEMGFYDQGGSPELTVPIGTHVNWIQGTQSGVYPRPEMDFKDIQLQPEVYEGRFSASGSYRHAKGTYFLVTDEIFVDPARLARASCAYMHVFDGGGGGARCGIVNGDGPWADLGVIGVDAISAASWGAWVGTYGDEAVPNRKWVTLSTPAIQPMEGWVRIVMQFNSDWAAPSAAGHWDAIVLEQDLENGEPGNGEIDWGKLKEVVKEATLESLAEWDRR